MNERTPGWELVRRQPHLFGAIDLSWQLVDWQRAFGHECAARRVGDRHTPTTQKFGPAKMGRSEGGGITEQAALRLGWEPAPSSKMTRAAPRLETTEFGRRRARGPSFQLFQVAASARPRPKVRPEARPRRCPRNARGTTNAHRMAMRPRLTAGRASPLSLTRRAAALMSQRWQRWRQQAVRSRQAAAAARVSVAPPVAA